MKNQKEFFPEVFQMLASQRGVMLLLSYLLISVMAIFSLALFSRSHVFTQTNERNQNRVVAFNMAEAGLDLAISTLRSNTAYEGTGGYTSLATANVQGGYEVTVTEIEPKKYSIQSAGYSPDNTVT